jgi:hypothetical protein
MLQNNKNIIRSLIPILLIVSACQTYKKVTYEELATSFVKKDGGIYSAYNQDLGTKAPFIVIDSIYKKNKYFKLNGHIEGIKDTVPLLRIYACTKDGLTKGKYVLGKFLTANDSLGRVNFIVNEKDSVASFFASNTFGNLNSGIVYELKRLK